MKCKLMVAEDELIERKVLCKTLQKYLGDLITLYEAKNGREALEIFEREKPQVAVLDIEMPGATGLEVARRIRETDKNCAILFLTGFDKFAYAKQAISVRAMDYLLKPYKEEKIRHLVGELRRILCRQEPELNVKIARKTVQLPFSRIHYALSRNHVVQVVTDDGECRASDNFAQVEQQLLKQDSFLVCNRGVIVNMDKVLRFDDDCIEMLDGAHLPVRQKDKNALFAHFTQYQFRHMRQGL